MTKFGRKGIHLSNDIGLDMVGRHCNCPYHFLADCFISLRCQDLLAVIMLVIGSLNCFVGFIGNKTNSLQMIMNETKALDTDTEMEIKVLHLS